VITASYCEQIKTAFTKTRRTNKFWEMLATIVQHLLSSHLIPKNMTHTEV